ncbi:MAG: molybdenum cofactor biosynthesis protein MoaE [Hyphomicrobiales bacterium]
MIRVQEEPFNSADELAKIKSGNTDIGATCMFLGTVREMSGGDKLTAMTLEHYPGMTEAALAEIDEQANARWPLEASLIVHRYGRMEPGEDIVLVITCSSHRQAAFEAAEFLMDWLKTKAPFWKLEEGSKGGEWVDARESDDEAAARWAVEPDEV